MQDVRREFVRTGQAALGLVDLVGMALDTASGMTYLNSMKHTFVHRDIAARNLLVHEEGDRLCVKISDFGLAKDLHYIRSYRAHGKAVLPVRWMAPEALLDGFEAEVRLLVIASGFTNLFFVLF